MEKKIYTAPAIVIVFHNVMSPMLTSVHETVGNKIQLSRGHSYGDHGWDSEDEEN